jgi:hypothetical protein
MGRTANKGLEYYPFDTDFFSDIKVRRLIRRQGGQAVTVYACALCFIYKNGYYIGADNELAFIISEQTGYEEAYIQEVLKCCLSLGLFDKEMYEKEKVFTSKGIQERYARICSLTKKRSGVSEYSLITSERKAIVTEVLPIVTERKAIVTEVMQQRKEKERKENTPPLLPRGERKEEEEDIFYSLKPPNDGRNRNFEGLLLRLKGMSCAENEKKQIILMSNYGEKGNPVWTLFAEIDRGGIKLPARFILSRLREGQTGGGQTGRRMNVKCKHEVNE